MVAELTPDVVLMDLRLPGIDGVTATALIVAAGKRRVPVLPTYDADTDIVRALAAGAIGYLLKDAPRDVLLRGACAVPRPANLPSRALTSVTG